MLKSIRHDPREKLPSEQRKRIESMESDLLALTPDEIEEWVDITLVSLADTKRVVKKLARAVAELSASDKRRSAAKKTG